MSAPGAGRSRPSADRPRPSLIGRSLPELALAVVGLGEAERKGRMRARQLGHWIYRQGACDFAQMTTLPRSLRAALAEAYSIARPDIVAEQVSADGTRKWLLRLEGGQEVEMVHIPEDDRGALCIST